MASKNIDFSKEVNALNIPFYFDATIKNDNGGFPKTLPFRVKLDNNLGMFVQLPDSKLIEILKKAYHEGSMLAGGMNDVIIGKTRSNSAIKFIKHNFSFKEGARVLEIGCGEGQIIKSLSSEGIKCVGLEPGPQVLEIENKNLSVIRDFFPSDNLQGKFDLILHFGVIEHIEDPVNFLRDQIKFLKDDGSIICGFPDFEADLKAGDISMFLHEHFNYFTKYSIGKVADLAGLKLIKSHESEGGGLVFAKLVREENKNRYVYDLFLEKKFIERFKNLKNNVQKFFNNVEQSDVAVYCPLRAMNLFYILGITNCRLVDDNPNLQNKYLPAFNRAIESFDGLKENPPQKIFIYSRTFNKVIKDKCQKELTLNDVEIFSITDFESPSR